MCGSLPRLTENLPAATEKGTFRADLLDRLSFEVITLPSTRAREGCWQCLLIISGGVWRPRSAGVAGQDYSEGTMAEMGAYVRPVMCANFAM